MSMLRDLISKGLRRLYPDGSVRRVVRGATGVRFLVAPSMRATFALGIGYHPREFQKWVKPGARVIDIGANRGQSTLMLRFLAGEKGLVIACEPVPEIYETLARNLDLNGYSNVKAVRAAVAENVGRLTFEYSPNFSTQGRISGVEETYRVGETEQLSVETITLDELRQSNNLDVDFIKIDVEGAAGEVFRGGDAVFTSDRPIVFIELHGPDEQSAVKEFLKSYRYSAEGVTGREVEDPTKGWESPLILAPDVK